MDILELGWDCSVSSKKGNYSDEEIPKHHSVTGIQNICNFFQKTRQHARWVGATVEVQVQEEMANFTRHEEDKDGKTMWQMSSEPAGQQTLCTAYC